MLVLTTKSGFSILKISSWPHKGLQDFSVFVFEACPKKDHYKKLKKEGWYESFQILTIKNSLRLSSSALVSGSRVTEGIRRGGGGGSEGGGRSEAETLLQPAKAEKKIITTNNMVTPAF